MSSPQQIEANRRNAQLSTGPKSADGKQKSSANSTRHGLAAASIAHFPPELAAEYTAFRDELLAEMAPASAIEQTYFEQFVFSRFMYLRAQIVEACAMSSLLRRPAEPTYRRDLDRAARYTRSHASSAARALKEFQNLQVNRLAAAELQETIGQPEVSGIVIPIALPLHRILHSKEQRATRQEVALRIIAASQPNEANPDEAMAA